MKEKFMNIVNKVKSMDRGTIVKVAVVGIGSLAGVMLAGYLINEAQRQEEFAEMTLEVEYNNPEIQ